jgi:PEP-CTERM motif-containing protein
MSAGAIPFSTSWSESKAYDDVTISALVDSFIVGQTPTADAYLTTRIGPGTSTTDEIAHAQFTVPLNLPICSPNSCGANVTLFSGLNLGPGTYFLTMATDPTSVGTVGWFPANPPTVIKDTGVTEGLSFIATAGASYPPASDFRIFLYPMNFTVVAVPEPAAWILIGLGTLLLFLRKQTLPPSQSVRNRFVHCGN